MADNNTTGTTKPDPIPEATRGTIGPMPSIIPADTTPGTKAGPISAGGIPVTKVPDRPPDAAPESFGTKALHVIEAVTGAGLVMDAVHGVEKLAARSGAFHRGRQPGLRCLPPTLLTLTRRRQKAMTAAILLRWIRTHVREKHY